MRILFLLFAAEETGLLRFRLSALHAREQIFGRHAVEISFTGWWINGHHSCIRPHTNFMKPRQGRCEEFCLPCSQLSECLTITLRIDDGCDRAFQPANNGNSLAKCVPAASVVVPRQVPDH